MDPNAALAKLLSLLNCTPAFRVERCELREEYMQVMEDLIEWLNKGGLLPDLHNPQVSRAIILLAEKVENHASGA